MGLLNQTTNQELDMDVTKLSDTGITEGEEMNATMKIQNYFATNFGQVDSSDDTTTLFYRGSAMHKQSPSVKNKTLRLFEEQMDDEESSKILLSAEATGVSPKEVEDDDNDETKTKAFTAAAFFDLFKDNSTDDIDATIRTDDENVDKLSKTAFLDQFKNSLSDRAEVNVNEITTLDEPSMDISNMSREGRTEMIMNQLDSSVIPAEESTKTVMKQLGRSDVPENTIIIVNKTAPPTPEETTRKKYPFIGQDNFREMKLDVSEDNTPNQTVCGTPEQSDGKVDDVPIASGETPSFIEAFSDKISIEKAKVVEADSTSNETSSPSFIQSLNEMEALIAPCKTETPIKEAKVVNSGGESKEHQDLPFPTLPGSPLIQSTEPTCITFSQETNPETMSSYGDYIAMYKKQAEMSNTTIKHVAESPVKHCQGVNEPQTATCTRSILVQNSESSTTQNHQTDEPLPFIGTVTPNRLIAFERTSIPEQEASCSFVIDASKPSAFAPVRPNKTLPCLTASTVSDQTSSSGKAISPRKTYSPRLKLKNSIGLIERMQSPEFNIEVTPAHKLPLPNVQRSKTTDTQISTNLVVTPPSEFADEAGLASSVLATVADEAELASSVLATVEMIGLKKMLTGKKIEPDLEATDREEVCEKKVETQTDQIVPRVPTPKADSQNIEIDKLQRVLRDRRKTYTLKPACSEMESAPIATITTTTTGFVLPESPSDEQSSTILKQQKQQRKAQKDRRKTYTVQPVQEEAATTYPINKTITLDKEGEEKTKKTINNKKNRRKTYDVHCDTIIAEDDKWLDESANFEHTLTFKPPIANSSMMVPKYGGLLTDDDTTEVITTATTINNPLENVNRTMVLEKKSVPETSVIGELKASKCLAANAVLNAEKSILKQQRDEELPKSLASDAIDSAKRSIAVDGHQEEKDEGDLTFVSKAKVILEDVQKESVTLNELDTSCRSTRNRSKAATPANHVAIQDATRLTRSTKQTTPVKSKQETPVKTTFEQKQHESLVEPLDTTTTITTTRTTRSKTTTTPTTKSKRKSKTPLKSKKVKTPNRITGKKSDTTVRNDENTSKKV